MLTSFDLVKILRETSLLLNHSIEMDVLQSLERENRNYADDEFSEFQRDLLEACTKIKLLLLQYATPLEGFSQFLSDENVLLGFKRINQKVVPVLIERKRKKINYHYVGENITEQQDGDSVWLQNEKREIRVFVIFPYKNLVSEEDAARDFKPGPMKRFLRLLSTEKKEIMYILFYGIIIGLISLVLPLGIQTTIEFISGGVFFSSVYLLIGLVILGVLLSGVFQIVQITLVEHLQRRIFTKAAFEFAFRIPRLKIESRYGKPFADCDAFQEFLLSTIFAVS